MEPDQDISETIDAMVAAAALDDALFAQAYAAVTPQQRAWIKTCIARLHQWYAPVRVRAASVRADWVQGFSSHCIKQPRTGSTVFFDHQVGPAALLAALLPARCSGVGQVLACHVGADVPQSSLLVALELAGQEDVVSLSADQARELALLHAGPERCCVALGGALGGFSPRGPLWCGPSRRTVGLWLDGGGDDPDLEAVAFAHPEARVTVMGQEPPSLPQGVIFQGGGFEEFLCQGFHGVFLPLERADAALTNQCLVLGPGQEGCWLYPGLPDDHFTFKRIAWTTPGGNDDHGVT